MSVDELAFEPGMAKFDLTLFLRETAEGWVSLWEYNTDLFDEATVARMAAHYARLLEGAVAHPEQRLSELPLLSEAERHQLLVEWNATRAEYPRDALHPRARSRRRRARRPEALALADEGQAADVPRAGRAGQPAGAPPAGAGRGPGGRWRACAWSARWTGGGRARHPQGGRRVRAAGPGVPGGAASVQWWRTAGAGGADAARAGGPLGGRGAVARGVPGRGGVLEARPKHAPESGRGRGAPGLRHLHVGLDGQAQGRGGDAPEPGQPGGVVPADVRGDAGGQGAAGGGPVLRRVGLRGVAEPRWRERACTCPRRRCVPSRDGCCSGWRRSGSPLAFMPTPMAEAALEEPWPEGLVLRALQAGETRCTAGRGRALKTRAGEPVRPDGEHGRRPRCCQVRPRARRESCRTSAGRSPTCGCTCWTRGWSRCRWGCGGSCTSGARAWRAGTWTGRS